MPASRCVGLIIVFALASSVWAARALAQQDPLAQNLKKSGDEAMIDGRYDAALEAYTRAIAIEETAALHYNRGRALQALERYAEALPELERFERHADAALRLRVPNFDALIAGVRAHVATLSVGTNVAGAILQVSEGQRVPLPFDQLRIDAGNYVLEASAPGYEPQRKELIVRGGEQVRVRFDLIEISTRAVLLIQSPVIAAEVWVDRKRMGNVPLEIGLAPGEHRVTLRHVDYQEASTRVVLSAKEHKRLSIGLEKQRGLYTRWWLWTGVAVVVGGGVAAVVLATRPQDPKKGDIPPGVVAAPLKF